MVDQFDVFVLVLETFKRVLPEQGSIFDYTISAIIIIAVTAGLVAIIKRPKN